MKGSASKMEIMKPVVLKAGIPLAVTLAGFVLARIATRRSSSPTASSSPSKIREADSSEVYADDHREEACSDQNVSHSSAMKEHFELQEEILGLNCKIQDFQNREWRLEKRFQDYQDLKEQEIGLMELRNNFMLDIKTVEFLEREISLLENEKHMFDNIFREYLDIMREAKEHCWIFREKCLLIQSKETEISKSKIELEAKADCIRLMEDEMKELKLRNELLLRENNEISYKLRVAEESVKSKAEGKMVMIENYNQLSYELDHLLKDETTEIEGLICVKWSNACLRHELMRRNQEKEQNKESKNNFGGIRVINAFGSDNVLNRDNVGQRDSSSDLTTQSHDGSKRRKLIEKFKRWIEKEKHDKNKCSPKLCFST